MKNSKFGLIAIAFLTLTMSSCKKVVFDAGRLTTETRNIDNDFTEIEIDGSIDVYVNQDSTPLKVEAGENILKHIETYVQNGVLYIEEESNNFLTRKPRRVFVSVEWLDRIKMKGSGDLEVDNIMSDTFTLKMDGSGDSDVSFNEVNDVILDLSGSGDCKFSGVAESLYVGLNGSGDVNAKLLESETAVVNVNGSGDVDVYATEMLTVNINGSGDVSYWGDPSETNFNINGSGDINRIN